MPLTPALSPQAGRERDPRQREGEGLGPFCEERRGDMKGRKPLTDESGEVRELLMEDIRQFRPMAEGLGPSLAAKLGISIPAATPAPAKRNFLLSIGAKP